MLAAALFINYVDRGALPTAAHLIQAELHLSKAQLGVLMSAFFWTYASAQIPVGWLAERYGAQRVLAAGLSVWAVATILTGVSSVFPALLLLRLLLGLGESAGFPCVSKLLAAEVPRESLGRANGMVSFAYLFGPAVGTYAGGLLMARYGWRASFLVFGSLSLLWLLPWSRVAAQQATLRQAPVRGPTLADILRQRSLWGTGLGHFSSNYTYYFLLSWLPFYLVRERGYSTVEMAELTGLAYVVSGVCALASGWMVDAFIARGGSANAAYKSAMAAAHGGAVICMLCMALGPRPLVLASIFVYLALVGAASPGVFAVAQIVAGPQAAGRWVGIQNTIGNLAGVVAPALTGFIIQSTGHFTAAFIVAAVVSLLGLIGWVLILPAVRQLHWNTGQRGQEERTVPV